MEKLHVQPSELDALPFYEYEYTFEFYNDIIKQRNSEDENQQSSVQDKYNPNSMNRNIKNNFGNLKPPKINIPKIR